jgi:uncharacterized metal-binding protein YceD (DUF177 family)
MANPLFDRALPEDLATIRQHIEYKGEIAESNRLVKIVEAELATVSEDTWPRGWRAATVDIRLDFAWMDLQQKIPTVSGRVSAAIPAVCQRCLEVFDLTLDVSVDMLLISPNVQNDDFGETADHEVWDLEEEELRPYDIVEESLVMAIPLAPRHESPAACGALAGEIAESGLKTTRPFADLRSQMEISDKE